MKKIFTLVLVAIFAFALLGCQAQNNSQTNNSNTTNNNTSNGSGKTDKNLKIVIVTSPSSVDDGSFNQDNYNGIKNFIKDHPGATVQTLTETNVNNAINTVESVVADYDVIVTPGFQFTGIYSIAQANPTKDFILVDSFPTDKDSKEVEASNIYAMQFAEQESGFYAGVAAAMQTKTGKVAVVNGIGYPSNVNYQFGFESGVNYANKHLNTSATMVALPSYAGKDVNGNIVGGNYIGNFNDPATGKVVGNALLDKGVDIIFVAAGASGNGVFTAVKERGNAYVIGCDVDQYSDGANGSSNIVLTSALKVMAPNVTKQLEAINDGTFTGGNYTLTAVTDSTGIVTTPGSMQLSDSTVTELDTVYQLVKNGTIVPASNFNGSKPDNFKGL